MKTTHILTACAAALATAASAQTLHYDRPARYFEEALLIGNGRIGAIVYGDARGERLALNDITLWSGEPEDTVFSPDAYLAIPEIRAALDRGDYRAADSLQRRVQGHYTADYHPLGYLTVDYPGRAEAVPADYRRSLDLGTATASAGYTVGGYPVECRYYASAPDSVIVMELTTADPAGIDADIRLGSQLPHTTAATAGALTMDGYGAWRTYPGYAPVDIKAHFDPDRGTRFRTVVQALAPDGGTVEPADSSLRVRGAGRLRLIVANTTSFEGHDRNPARPTADYRAAATRIAARAAAMPADTLRARQQADYRALYDRVSLDLGATDPAVAALPTDRQLLLYTDSAMANPDLEETFFQLGRYLLISSSRTDGVPANLQGLWNEKMSPPWSSNYTTNINLEENYWPATVTNLAEMAAPLHTFVRRLADERHGQLTARHYYGVDNGGWALGQNSDIWATTNPVGMHTGDPCWANWTMGGAWLASQLYDSYLFSQDRDMLAADWPALRGAALFCLDWLVERDGELITSPGTSPENVYLTPEGYAGATLYGATADLAMARQCLLDARDAARILDTDAALVERIDSVLPRLRPYHIGSRGNLMEWYHDWADAEPTHRHQSHLYGIYPGRHITPADNPDLVRAAERTLELKGDRTTGWSTAWRVNLSARMGDADGAYHFYRTLLRYVSPDDYAGADARRGGGTYPNLLGAHAPYQIDSNFGGSAGVAEMLLGSHIPAGTSTPRITLLPALPAAWPGGSVRGLRARGGVEADIDWADGRLSRAVLRSTTGRPVEAVVVADGREIPITINTQDTEIRP